jgi:hypothetical protein
MHGKGIAVGRATKIGAAAALMVVLAAFAAAAGPLDDRIEAVVVKGKVLPAKVLEGELANYRVLVTDGAGLKVIPMQIDECDAKGALILTEGPKAGKGDGKFSADDELVFMAADAGPAITAVPPAGCADTATLTISDAKTGAKGYVLVAKCQTPPPASTTTYVKYDLNTHIGATDHYRFGFEKKLAFFYDYLAVGKGPDLLDRLKVRLTIGKFGVNYTFNEDENFKYEYLGSVRGPVRTVLLSSNSYHLGPFGQIPVPQFIYFYRSHVTLINQMDSSLNPAILGLDFNIAIGHDLTIGQQTGDYKICTNGLPECASYKDKMPPERIKQINEMDTVWGGFSGPDGSLISYFVPDKRLPTKTHSIYVDDTKPDTPESVPGNSPLISFNVIDWSKAKAAVYNLDFYHFFIDKYSPAEVERYARLVKQPLEVSAK